MKRLKKSKPKIIGTGELDKWEDSQTDLAVWSPAGYHGDWNCPTAGWPKCWQTQCLIPAHLLGHSSVGQRSHSGTGLSAQGLPRLNSSVSCAQVSPGGSGDKHASGPLLEAEFSSHGYENKVPVSQWLSAGHTPLPEAACVPATWPLHLQDHESSSCFELWHLGRAGENSPP